MRVHIYVRYDVRCSGQLNCVHSVCHFMIRNMRCIHHLQFNIHFSTPAASLRMQAQIFNVEYGSTVPLTTVRVLEQNLTSDRMPFVTQPQLKLGTHFLWA